MGELLIENWDITLEIINIIGDRVRKVLTYGLPSLRNLIKNSGDLRIIAEIGKASGESAKYVLEMGLPCFKNLIKSSGDLREIGLIIAEIGKASGENAEHVLIFALPSLGNLIKNSDYLRIIVEIINASEEYNVVVLTDGLPHLENLIKSSDDLREIGLIIANKFKKHYYRTILILRGKKEIKNIRDIEEKEELVDYYIRKLGESEYTTKIITENLDELASPDKTFNRLEFEKTGSVLIPLGGKLIGYLYRIVTQDAYEAWLRAEEFLTESDGTCHCEEIIKKRGKPRIIKRKDGLIAVMTRYAGEALRSYKPANQEESDEINRQIGWIVDKIVASGIRHGHLHGGNYTVLKQKGRIILKVIDFDQAVSP